MTVLPLDLARSLTRALADGPEAVIEQVVDLLRVLPGVTAVTILAAAADKSVIRRVGTSHQDTFPIGGTDVIDDGAWCRRIFGDKLPVVGNSPEEMSVYIPETDQLVAIGVTATMCVPVIIGSEVMGAVCVLGAAGILTPELIDAVDAIMPIAALIFTFDRVCETVAGANDNR